MPAYVVYECAFATHRGSQRLYIGANKGGAGAVIVLQEHTDSTLGDLSIGVVCFSVSSMALILVMHRCLAADTSVQTYSGLFCPSAHPSAFFDFVSASRELSCKKAMFQDQSMCQTLSINMTSMLGGRVLLPHCANASSRAEARRHGSRAFPLAAWLRGFSGLFSLAGVQPESPE
jgi:hypothetical protein